MYQYKDHLGNVRVSFGRNSAGALEITDANDYYPFGMNHLKTGNAFYGKRGSGYINYKFLGKELQETGFYDMGARFYMPELGIFAQHDPLSAATLDPYGYAYNNPMFFSDPTGLYGAQINKKGELPATSPGGSDNPIDVGEVVVNAPIRAMASAIPSNCSYCYVGNGKNLVNQLNLPALRPISADINASNINKYFPPVLHNGSAQMMSGDPFGFSDLLGVLFAKLEPDNQEAALGLSALAIILTKGKAAPGIIKAEAAAEKGILTTEKGAFSVVDWTGYPNSLPKPKGPFKLLEGAEYDIARKAANNANRTLHKANQEFKGLQIHEIHPVKFGGNPTNPLNKALLTPEEHRLYNTFWFKLQNSIKK